MKKITPSHVAAVTVVLSMLLFSSCFDAEDPGPLQRSERQYPIVDFDRLEMGSAFRIQVQQGSFFKVMARGDRRNLDDLMVYKDGSTLVIRYEDSGNRRHETFIDITLPVIKSANFSGASFSTVTGFDDQDSFGLVLSGASVSQINIDAADVDLVVSGASNLTLTGEGVSVSAEVSGASMMNTFNFTADDVDINASGASQVKVYAAEFLNATATGASMIYYRGEPVVTSHVSGASAVVHD